MVRAADATTTKTRRIDAAIRRDDDRFASVGNLFDAVENDIPTTSSTTKTWLRWLDDARRKILRRRLAFDSSGSSHRSVEASANVSGEEEDDENVKEIVSAVLVALKEHVSSRRNEDAETVVEECTAILIDIFHGSFPEESAVRNILRSSDDDVLKYVTIALVLYPKNVDIVVRSLSTVQEIGLLSCHSSSSRKSGSNRLNPLLLIERETIKVVVSVMKQHPWDDAVLNVSLDVILIIVFCDGRDTRWLKQLNDVDGLALLYHVLKRCVSFHRVQQKSFLVLERTSRIEHSRSALDELEGFWVWLREYPLSASPPLVSEPNVVELSDTIQERSHSDHDSNLNNNHIVWTAVKKKNRGEFPVTETYENNNDDDDDDEARNKNMRKSRHHLCVLLQNMDLMPAAGEDRDQWCQRTSTIIPHRMLDSFNSPKKTRNNNKQKASGKKRVELNDNSWTNVMEGSRPQEWVYDDSKNADEKNMKSFPPNESVKPEVRRDRFETKLNHRLTILPFVDRYYPELVGSSLETERIKQKQKLQTVVKEILPTY